MRRSKTFAASLLASAVVAVPVLAPVAGAAPAQEVPAVSCPAAAPPVCSALDQATALLAPLRPVLALGGPGLGPLGASVARFDSVVASGPAVPAQDLASAAGALRDQLAGVTGPALGLLRQAGVDIAPLDAALASVQAGAQSVLDAASAALVPAGPEAQPAPAAEPSPAPRGPAASGGTTATSSSSPAGFSGSLSTAEPSSPTSLGPLSTLPKVPVGGSVALAPLGLPEFAFGSEPFASSPSSLEDLPSLSDAAQPVIETVAAAAHPGRDEDKATAVVIALSVLALVAGLLIDQTRKARQLFPLEP